MYKVGQASEVIRSISQRTDRVLLFYSGGKDSIVLLDLLTPHFKEVVCVFMYFVKDLDHIDRYLSWATKRYSNVTMMQVPHWNLTYVLRSGTFCVPNPRVKLMKLADVDKAVKLQTGIEYSFYGMKKADSLNRRLMLMSEGPVIGDKVYPLSDWTGKEVLAYMKQKKLPMPVRYSDKASGGVGFSPECYRWMKHNAPGDLEKVLRAFPLSEKILIDNQI